MDNNPQYYGNQYPPQQPYGNQYPQQTPYPQQPYTNPYPQQTPYPQQPYQAPMENNNPQFYANQYPDQQPTRPRSPGPAMMLRGVLCLVVGLILTFGMRLLADVTNMGFYYVF